MPDQYKKQALSRDKILGAILEELKLKVNSAQARMLGMVLEEVIAEMDIKDGFILNNSRNRRLLFNVDVVFKRFADTYGVDVIKTIIDSTQKIINFNANYFKSFDTKIKMAPINQKVAENVGAWLGINEKEGIEPNGYLDVLLKDQNIRNQVKNQIAQAIITRQGHNSVTKGIKEFIAGKPGQTGAFDRYYRNFVTDTFSQVDRATSQIYADNLGLDYAIYEGGLIETSRKFCIRRNGKVFSREEIALFDPGDKLRPPGYNPFTDLGGYGCRHHLNWVPKSVAFALRPELKDLS